MFSSMRQEKNAKSWNFFSEKSENFSCDIGAICYLSYMTESNTTPNTENHNGTFGLNDRPSFSDSEDFGLFGWLGEDEEQEEKKD